MQDPDQIEIFKNMKIRLIFRVKNTFGAIKGYNLVKLVINLSKRTLKFFFQIFFYV